MSYRVRVLWEDYDPNSTEMDANRLAEQVSGLLTDLIPFGKVITYVEANPPKDEVEDYD